MKCLVCQQTIKINRFNELFMFESLLLCDRCFNQLESSKSGAIFKENEWINHVIDRLNRGDILLIEIFKRPLSKILKKYLKQEKEIIIVNLEEQCPYPWMHILVDEIKYQFTPDEQKRLNVKWVSSFDGEGIRLK